MGTGFEFYLLFIYFFFFDGGGGGGGGGGQVGGLYLKIISITSKYSNPCVAFWED